MGGPVQPNMLNMPKSISVTSTDFSKPRCFRLLELGLICCLGRASDCADTLERTFSDDSDGIILIKLSSGNCIDYKLSSETRDNNLCPSSFPLFSHRVSSDHDLRLKDITRTSVLTTVFQLQLPSRFCLQKSQK